MNLMRNIVGILAMTAVILSGVLLGLPGEANAKLHGGAAHFDGVTKVHGSGHHGPGHNEHAHDHHDKSESMHPGATGHAEHGPCNAMACCPVVSLAVSDLSRTRSALRICHWPDLSILMVEAAPESADKPPRRT